MGRTPKIALVAMLGALVLSLAIVSATPPSAFSASASQISRADAPPRAAPVPPHCRTAVEPDAECAAAWSAKRRRFFGQKDETHE
jgi:conjugative transfer region protein TrbK